MITSIIVHDLGRQARNRFLPRRWANSRWARQVNQRLSLYEFQQPDQDSTERNLVSHRLVEVLPQPSGW